MAVQNKCRYLCANIPQKTQASFRFLDILLYGAQALFLKTKCTQHITISMETVCVHVAIFQSKKSQQACLDLPLDYSTLPLQYIYSDVYMKQQPVFY